MQYTPKNILVTGGAGFIGCNFIRYLLNKSHETTIINIDRLSYAGSYENMHDFINNKYHIFIQGDICDNQLILKILNQYNIDTIVHFAAESHVDRSIADPEIFIQTNIVGTFRLLKIAKHYWLDIKKFTSQQCRFHHISTDEVFGSLTDDEQAFQEKNPYLPNSPYSASKASADHLVRSYYHTFQLPITMSNCSNNYGPYQHQEKFIPTVIKSCITQTDIPIYGNGSNIRDWLYVTDHCQAIDKIIREAPIGESYNIGGNKQLSNLELVSYITALMDVINPKQAPHQRLLKFVSDRAGHDWRYAIDTNKIENKLNWKPETSFAAGLEKTIHWYLTQAKHHTLEVA